MRDSSVFSFDDRCLAVLREQKPAMGEVIRTALLAEIPSREIIALIEEHAGRAGAILAAKIGNDPEMTKKLYTNFLNEHRRLPEKHLKIQALYKEIPESHKSQFLNLCFYGHFPGSSIRSYLLDEAVRYFRTGKIIPRLDVERKNDILDHLGKDGFIEMAHTAPDIIHAYISALLSVSFPSYVSLHIPYQNQKGNGGDLFHGAVNLNRSPFRLADILSTTNIPSSATSHKISEFLQTFLSEMKKLLDAGATFDISVFLDELNRFAQEFPEVMVELKEEAIFTKMPFSQIEYDTVENKWHLVEQVPIVKQGRPVLTIVR